MGDPESEPIITGIPLDWSTGQSTPERLTLPVVHRSLKTKNFRDKWFLRNPLKNPVLEWRAYISKPLKWRYLLWWHLTADCLTTDVQNTRPKDHYGSLWRIFGALWSHSYVWKESFFIPKSYILLYRNWTYAWKVKMQNIEIIRSKQKNEHDQMHNNKRQSRSKSTKSNFSLSDASVTKSIKSGNWGLDEIDCHCSHKGQCTS